MRELNEHEIDQVSGGVALHERIAGGPIPTTGGAYGTLVEDVTYNPGHAQTDGHWNKPQTHVTYIVGGSF